MAKRTSGLSKSQEVVELLKTDEGIKCAAAIKKLKARGVTVTHHTFYTARKRYLASQEPNQPATSSGQMTEEAFDGLPPATQVTVLRDRLHMLTTKYEDLLRKNQVLSQLAVLD